MFLIWGFYSFGDVRSFALDEILDVVMWNNSGLWIFLIELLTYFSCFQITSKK